MAGSASGVIKRTGHGGVGWEHVDVDDRTRVPYVKRLASDGAASYSASLSAPAYFADLVRVRRVMTDNPFSYVHARPGPSWGFCRGSGPMPGRARTTATGVIALPALVHHYTHSRRNGELGGLTLMNGSSTVSADTTTST